MTKKVRLIILIVCIFGFFSIAPVLVFYSMGYRFNLSTQEITSTGGIFVKTSPVAEHIIIDSKITEKPGMFSNSIFIQSLQPGEHTVLVQKNGYFDYFKTLPVQEKTVTKLEEVLLIKKDMQFETAPSKVNSPFDATERFIIKNNNLYYSKSPENSAIPELQKTSPIIKKIVAFALSPFEESFTVNQNNNIVWLGTDGFVYKSDLVSLSAPAVKITLTPIKISSKGVYKIISDSKNMFLNNNGSLMIFDATKNDLRLFDSSAKDAKISPDGKNIIYYDDKNVYISPVSGTLSEKNILYKTTKKINDCIWLNNYYIIITDGPASPDEVGGDKIIISETDLRGNINAVEIPAQGGLVSGWKNSKIFFSQQQGQLYILTGTKLLVSEKITQ